MNIKLLVISIFALLVVVRVLSFFNFPSTYDQCRGVDRFLEKVFPRKIHRIDFCSYQVSNKVSVYKFEKCENNLGEIQTPDKAMSDNELICTNIYINPKLFIPSDFLSCAQNHPIETYKGKRECSVLTGTGYALNNSVEQKKLGEKLLNDCRQLASSDLIKKEIYDSWCRIHYYE